MITDLKIIKDIKYLFQYKLIIYGAGTSGQMLFDEITNMNITIEAFCETSSSKKTLNNIPVLNQSDLKTLLDTSKNKFLIIIASAYHNEIYEDLLKKNITGEGIISSFAVRQSIYLNINYHKIPLKYREHYINMVTIWKKIQLDAVSAKKTMDDFRALTNILEHDLIVIYQPGKVGSTSIDTALKKAGICCQHIHILNNRKSTSDLAYKNLLEQLKNQKSKVRIITGVREPIARGISSFIHNLSQYNGWLIKDELTNDLCESCVSYLRNYTCNDNNAATNKPAHYFNQNEFTALGDQMGNEFAWFDKEIKTVYGIDIFAYPFDREQGYTIIKTDNIEIFVYKLEKLDSLESALSDFLGLKETLKLEKNNVVTEKVTKNLSKEIKENIVIPKECLDYYFVDNPRMKHFYTDKEIKEFYRKYEQRG